METVVAQRAARRPRSSRVDTHLVIALHCSGGTPAQWRHLANSLGPECRLWAPHLHAAPDGPSWEDERPYRLADEVEPIVSKIDAHQGPVHLVDHSYGGAIALQLAALRPKRISSLALYEPTPFHRLASLGATGADARDELMEIMRQIRSHVALGALREAAACTADYWNGTGAWPGFRPDLQDALVRYLPHGERVFEALFAETTLPEAYRTAGKRVRLLYGELAPLPGRVLTEALAHWMPAAELIILQGAGHMAPVIDADRVSRLMRMAP